MPSNDSWIYKHIDEFLKLDKIDQVKKLLEEEIADYKVYRNIERSTVSPILHNENKIILQFDGWCITLYDDGTWEWDDTTGG